MISILTWCLLLTGAWTGILASPQSRIIGGTDALPNEFPHQVALENYLRKEYRFICGGSIISDIWILTAAHCLSFHPRDNITVLVGTNKLDTGGVRHSLKRVIKHEDYKYIENKFIKNDIGLIELEKGVNASYRITLANTLPPVNSVCSFSGWGLTHLSSRIPSNNLQKFNPKFISYSDCKKRLLHYPVNEGNLCTTSPKGEGSCMGDSGGALVYNSTQIGIVSWVIPCGVGKPDVFTSVPVFRSWIKNKTGI